MTRHSYFMILVEIFRNHILAKSIYFWNRSKRAKHKITVLKPVNKCQIFLRCHSFKSILIIDLQHHPFVYRVKNL